MQDKSRYIVLLKGGIGNQLFQYAYAVYLSKFENKQVSTYFTSKGDRYNRENIIKGINTSVPLLSNNMQDRIITRIIDRPKNILTKLIKKLLGIFGMHFSNQRQKDNHHQYFKNLNSRGVTIMRGYWQSAEMVSLVKDELLKASANCKITSDEYIEILNEIEKQVKPVAIHIRDFSSSPNHSQQTLGNNYYQTAIDKILLSNKDAFFFIFANDNNYADKIVKDALPKSNYLLVPNADVPHKDLEALILMSKCKHFILSNSTFGWWGAWLGWARYNKKDAVFYMPNRWDMSSDAKSIAESFKFSKQCILLPD